MKSQDLEISQRVEDLSTSVLSLCTKQETQSNTCTSIRSSKSLRAIKESHSESDEASEESDPEDDDQSFEEYCLTTLSLIGDRRVSTPTVTATCPIQPSVEIVIGCADEDPKNNCVLNNTPYVITRKAQSYPVVNQIQNDLRQETQTVQSEPMLYTQRHTTTVSPVH